MTDRPIIGHMQVSGFTNLAHGQVITGIDIYNQAEARLLEGLVHQALRDMAGTPAEKTLARWSNSLAYSRQRARDQNWKGWQG